MLLLKVSDPLNPNWRVVAHGFNQSTDGTNAAVTLDTTGATTLFAWIPATSTGITFTDSKNGSGYANNAATIFAGGAAGRLYNKNPPVVSGSGHTFTATASTAYPCIFAAAFANDPVKATLWGTSNGSGAGPTVNVTPFSDTTEYALFLAVAATIQGGTMGGLSATGATALNFTMIDQADGIANAVGGGWGWLAQSPKTTTVGSAWTLSSGGSTMLANIRVQ